MAVVVVVMMSRVRALAGPWCIGLTHV
jgi:hypothetical protein